MKPKLAVINLDWLDGEIDKLHEKGATAGISSINDDDIRFDTLIEVHSKCTQIEEPNSLSALGKASGKYSGLLYGNPIVEPTINGYKITTGEWNLKPTPKPPPTETDPR